MKSQTLILLIVAAGCGLVAMLGVQQVLNKKGEDETQKVPVLQASVDIGHGEPVTETNTQFVSVELNTVPEGTVTNLEQISDRAAMIPINTGDWITQKKLSEVGDRGFSIIIPDGMQVSTIPVDATTSHSGMLQPGHRVDLMISYQDENEVGKRIRKVKRILQYVEVVAVDNKVYGINDDGEAGKAKNISLLVTPDQALFLELAKTQGRMSTVLRGNGDDEDVAADELSADELSGRKMPGVNHASARDTNRLPEFGAEQESAVSLVDQLRAEMGPLETGPVSESTPVPEGTWTIAIWQGSNVRLETVNLHSDIPVPSDTLQPASVMRDQSGLQVPMPPGATPDGKQGLEAFEGLKDAASDLWRWSLGD